MAALNTTRPFSCRRANASRQSDRSGPTFAPVIVTRRPPGARRFSAEAIWRKQAPATRLATCVIAENGGFIRMTLGAEPTPRWSSIWAASNRVTSVAGKREARRCPRRSESSLSASVVPAISANIASRPVPADGSSTTSPGVMPAAVSAAKPTGRGVENCWSAWDSSDRRVCVGSRLLILVSAERYAVGQSALRNSAFPNLRRKRTEATSHAS